MFLGKKIIKMQSFFNKCGKKNGIKLQNPIIGQGGKAYQKQKNNNGESLVDKCILKRFL